ncbi:MAG: hypothetical protein J6B71_00415 [Clostridia bacterium]|nr:hypothetical protein [Clostridia bacterium]
MKKILICITLTLCTLLLFVSCKAEPQQSASDTTVTQGGNETALSDCHNGHTATVKPAVAPTCTETGLTEGSYCSVCNEVLVEQKEIPATGHTDGGWVVRTDPTCVEKGVKDKVCAVCNSIIKTTYIPPVDHTVVIDEMVPATCTATGLTEGSHCSFCNIVFKKQKVIPMTNLGNENVKLVSHRGYVDAPENTLSAYRLSKNMGFAYVECDVLFTKDGVPVLHHDVTVDRTSNGTGKLADKTLAELKELDLGSWKSEEYEGEKIPTFEEFIKLCKDLGLHPYIELCEDPTEAQVKGLVDTVKSYGMEGKVTWISFIGRSLEYTKKYSPSARLGYLVSNVKAEDAIAVALSLKNGVNDVFVEAWYKLDANEIKLCKNNDLPLEVWTLPNETYMDSLDPYVSGITIDGFTKNVTG